MEYHNKSIQNSTPIAKHASATTNIQRDNEVQDAFGVLE